MKVCVLTTLASCIFLTMALAHPADASVRKTTNISAESLSDALRTLAKDRQFEILYRAEAVRHVRTQGAIGEFTPEEALITLLSGTGLAYKYLDSKTVTIMPTVPQTAEVAYDQPLSNPKDGGGKKTSQEFRLAQVDQRQSASALSVTNPTSTSTDNTANTPGGLAEIVVTAEKRSERLQDVPVSVTAIQASELVASNQLQLKDYYSQIPGLSLTPGLQSSQYLAIRGISAGPGNPTVGIAVDGVPYGSSTGLGGGAVVPDIDPGDLSRIEVLRGPQGTLYGASSMGGLINFITVDPSPDRLAGQVQAGTSTIKNGDGLGYEARGSVNVPINQTLAFRASAFARQDPGYIDNPVLNNSGLNGQHAFGGRVAAFWKPSDIFSLKLSALAQEIRSNGANDVDSRAGLGDLQQNNWGGTGGFERKVQAYSATATLKLGTAELSSVTAYNVNSFRDSFDYTSALGDFAQSGYPPLGIAGFGVPGVAAFQDNKTEKFSQEFKLMVPLGGRVDWLLGAFFTHEDSPYVQDVQALSTTAAVAGTMISFNQPSTLSETAVFTDLTWHITDAFDIQVGGRESHIKQSFMETDTGPFVPLFDVGSPSSPNVFPGGETSDNAFTYLVSPRWKVSSDLMLYARLASGYRAGGPNQAPGGIIPAQYSPDKTQDYEIGVKGDFVDHRISIDTSIYYLNWKNIQLSVADPTTGISYFVNSGTAKSEGVEFSVQARPTARTTIGAWIAWNEAVLTEPVPATATIYGTSGDRLPFGSRISGNLSARQEFPLGDLATGFFSAQWSYVGDREGPFASTASGSPDRQIYPSYARVDARAGAIYRSWQMSIYANNVADKRGILQGGLGYFPADAFLLIQPRTIGVSIVKSF